MVSEEAMSALRDVLARRRQELNPITTSIPPNHHLPTPSSAYPSSTMDMSLPHNYGQHQMYTPVSAARDYNPQQWNGGTSNTVHYSPEAAEAEIPPPYSPPRSHRPSTLSPQDAPSGLSPAHRTTPVHSRPSPEPTAAPVFPPPPGGRQRQASRDRTQAVFAFARRAATGDVAIVSPDPMRDQQRRPPPISVEHTRVEETNTIIDARPPASRRAASTGTIATQSTSRSRAPSMTRWEPGMPLPPPPPGPPPSASSRSQSLSRTPDPVISPPTRRPQISINTLGPVPPTPADWVDEDAAAVRKPSPNHGLTLDTSNIEDGVSAEPVQNSGSGSGGGLTRNRAVRGEPKSIRERRSESRSGRNPATTAEPSNNPWAEAITPSDITVPPMTVLGRRPSIMKNTPRSGKSLHTSADTPNSSRSLGQGTPSLLEQSSESRGSTPRPANSSRRTEAPTPPFSPDTHVSKSPYGSSTMAPKSLPTPPLQHRPNMASARSNHLFNHTINEGVMSDMQKQSPQDTTFVHEAMSRHNAFAKQEATAKSDEERVRLFAEYIVRESRLRRQRYASAIDGMGSEILELTRDLFRPFTSTQRPSARSFSSDRSVRQLESGSRGDTSNSTSQSDSRPGSATFAPSGGQKRPESAAFNGYLPSLSPIESVSQSQIPDENSSRGRPSSRWWEVGQEGSVGSPSRIERSKRESKYMGMSKELLESLQWESNAGSSSSGTPRGTTAGSSSQTSYGPNEYPPEKIGWHETTLSPPPHKTPTNAYMPVSPAPPTPNLRQLDISRLVTLPPPYPRHHPAVNNNHPDLTEIRTSVRTLTDFGEVVATKARFVANDTQIAELATAAALQRKKSLRSSIQREIEAGTMSYADAAQREAEHAVAESDACKATSKTSFDLYQTSVVGPLNEILMGRIDKAANLFETLRGQLFVDAQRHSPNATQEEGDEQPELLEKLTLLKWIFEAREQLHRELYDLLGERNDKYRVMVTLPYRLVKNEAKVADVERFFAADSQKRTVDFQSDCLKRTMEFMDVIESNVVRGVEVQLSAFWDIAPSLSQLMEKIPSRITTEFQVQIPAEEFDENPTYYAHPMQYLWSLLRHGERSTYQFIESQINLLCLLHEVKSVVAGAQARVADADAECQGSDAASAGTRVDQAERAAEESRLTEDLKEKVRCVEELWNSALGDEMHDVTDRIREYLVEDGGWDGVDEE